MEMVFKTVQQHKGRSLSEIVAQQISDLIKERNIEVGDQLPSEFELANILNVSRGTTREAIKILIARNCLEIRRGKGTFVTENIGQVTDPLGFDFVADKIRLAEELYEVRMQIEPWIASLAAKRIEEGEKEELRRRCTAVEEHIAAGIDHYETDKAFHQYIAQCTHNSVLAQIIPIITYSVRLFTRFKVPGILKDTVRTHRAITDAICNNDVVWAESSMRDHISSNLDCINELKKTSNLN